MGESRKPWLLTLFVAGNSPRSRAARANLQRLRDEHFTDQDVEVEFVDLKEDPDAAVAHEILAIPTLIRRRPEPELRVVGDMTDVSRVWALLSSD